MPTDAGMPAPADSATFGSVLRRHAANLAQHRAFVFLENGERESQSLTFAQLEARAVAVAVTLIEHDLTGKRVVLVYPSCLDFVVAVLGCFLAGAIAVPAPLAYRGNAFSRVRAILDDADASAILSLSALLRELGVQQDAPLSLPAGSHCIATDELDSVGPRTLPDIDPESLALLQYTSGSTGNPRGVMLTHANLMHNQRVLTQVVKGQSGEYGVHWLPLYHDMGLIGGVLHILYYGGCSVLMSPLSFLQRPRRWLNAMSRYRATISTAPSFAYDLCARRAPAPQSDLDLSNWRTAVCGGEPIRPQSLTDFATAFESAGFDRKSFLPAYGLAEATLMATAPAPGRDFVTRNAAQSSDDAPASLHSVPARQHMCCGRPMEGQRLVIVDPVSCRPVPQEHIGEIWIQGGSVAAGYWNRKIETEDTFHARLADDPQAGTWLRSGDLGFLCEDGLVITGRRKELIIVRGANFDPMDIEAAARESDPALSEGSGAAFPVETDSGEAVVLVHEVSRHAMKLLDVDAVTGRVVEAVSRRFGLALYDVVLLRPGTIPRTTSGKIQRHSCREKYLHGQLSWVADSGHPGLGRHRARLAERA